MPGGLLALTQAALLEHLDRDDAAYALRKLVADVVQHLGVACGLLAVDGDPEIPIPKRLDDLAVELNLLFLLGD